MFTAVIENEGNTLVMEFPCKRYLMADHLGSIGIRRSAHEIKCMDEEDEPIKVKLFGNNEFEKRLTLLVSPSDTLSLVNTMCEFYQNLPYQNRLDAMEAVMSGKVSSIAEFDKFMLESRMEDTTEYFYCPLVANVYSRDEYGAFHNESHHPHMHLMLYSTSQEKRGFIDKNGLDHLRHLFGTEMFKYELADIYDEQTKQRDLLNADAREEISALADKIRNGLADNGEFVMKFVTLAKRMQSVTGKKVYGYLPKSVKAMVNELVDLLEKDEDIDRIYELWYQAKCAVYATYTDNPPPRKPLSQEEAFKPIRNAMIKEADELGKILHTLDEEQKQTSGDAPEKSDDDKASKGGGASHTTCNTGSNTQATNTARAKSHSNYTTTRNGYIATSITRFGNSLSRIFCDRFDEQAKHAPMGVDSRLWREIEAKKKGQNITM